MITLYSSPTCGKCKGLKNWMNTNNIPFEELDVTENDEAQADLMCEGLTNLPVIKIDESYHSNYETLQNVIKEFTK